MKKLIALFLSLFISLFVFSPLVLAKGNSYNEQKVALDSTQVIDHDYFAAGDTVMLSGTVKGDAYIAGGNITVDGTVEGDLLVAGGNLNLHGTVLGDIRAAGGSISIASKVGGNITAAGGSVIISESATVPGSLVVGAGDLTILAPIGRGITTGAGNIHLDSTVKGDLNYWSDNEVSMGANADVTGVTKRHVPPQPPVDQQELGRAFASLAAIFKLFTFIGTLIVGILVIKLAPHFTGKVLNTTSKSPWKSLALGFAYFFLSPLAVIILTVTMVGIPLACIILLIYLILLMVGKIFACLYLGQQLVMSLSKQSNTYLHLLVGLLTYQLLWLIPMVGWLAIMVLFFMGIGGLMLYKQEYYLILSKKKLV